MGGSCSIVPPRFNGGHEFSQRSAGIWRRLPTSDKVLPDRPHFVRAPYRATVHLLHRQLLHVFAGCYVDNLIPGSSDVAVQEDEEDLMTVSRQQKQSLPNVEFGQGVHAERAFLKQLQRRL